jgi:hypothetical protein
MQPLFSRRRLALPLALAIAASCRGTTQVPEPGAVLLDVKLASGAQTPDEVRVSVYDDTGALWRDTRFPGEGVLIPASPSDLGTILIKPGTTAGPLRIDLRGLLGGLLVDEATLTIPAASLSGATFDVALSAALPTDGDGDGVPDTIDDCPSVSDPDQTGCGQDSGAGDDAGNPGRDAAMPGRDAGTPGRDAATPGRDAAADARADRAPPGMDASGDGAHGSKGQGAGCSKANECASGFCADGVCCNNACTGSCQSCSTGKCNTVKNGEDAPECVAPMTCNGAGKCVTASGTGG